MQEKFNRFEKRIYFSTNNYMQKVIEGDIVHAHQSEFEGSNGEIIRGANVEIVSGDTGFRVWIPKDCPGYEKALDGATVRLTCNVRVKDGGRLSYVATEIDVRS